MGSGVSNKINEGRLLWLDAARGLCALSVVIYHLLAWEYDIVLPSAGMLSVYAFFILSALSLCLVYKDEFGTSLDSNKLARFYINRFARIVPLLFLVSSIYFVWGIIKGGDILGGIVSYLITSSGLLSLGASGFVSNATGAWTIGVEIAFYIAFPVLFLLFGKTRILYLVLAAVILSAFQGGYAWHVYSSFDKAEAWPIYISLLSFCGFFAWGFVAHKVSRKNPLGAVSAVSAIIMLMLFVWQSLIVDFDRVLIISFPYSIVTSAFMGCCIIVLYKSANFGVLAYLKQNLGDVSYSSYLLHPFIIEAFSMIVPGDALSMGWHVLLVLVLTVFISKLVYEFFENPARRFLRRIV